MWMNRSWKPTTIPDSIEYIRKSWKSAEGYEVRDLYRSGKVQMTGAFRDPKLEEKTGQFVYFYASGQQSSAGKYIDGKKDGVWIDWHPNDQKEAEGVYQNGEREGKWLFWNTAGRIISEGEYIKGKFTGRWENLHDNGKVSSTGNYVDGKAEGKWEGWYANGQPDYVAIYKSGKLHGSGTWYYRNGRKSAEEVYQDGEKISGTYWDLLGNDVTGKVKEQAMPEYPHGGIAGLMKYFRSELVYPKKARRKGIEGRVKVRFVVGMDGNIIDPVVTESVDPLLDEEAVRVISGMPKWIPGIQHNRPVQVYYTLPVSFRLED